MPHTITGHASALRALAYPVTGKSAFCERPAPEMYDSLKQEAKATDKDRKKASETTGEILSAGGPGDDGDIARIGGESDAAIGDTGLLTCVELFNKGAVG